METKKKNNEHKRLPRKEKKRWKKAYTFLGHKVTMSFKNGNIDTIIHAK